MTLGRDLKLAREPLLRALAEAHNRMENAVLEELILMERIDRMCAQVD